MATIDGRSIEFIWVLFSVAGQAVRDFTDEAQSRRGSDARLAGNRVSVNAKRVAGTPRALIKVNAGSGWVATLPQGLQNQVEQVFTEADHHDAVTLVQSAGWEIRV